MSLKFLGILSCFIVVAVSQNWRGNYKPVLKSRSTRASYCACWYQFWGCSYYLDYWRTEYYYENQCQPGWTHGGDNNCNILALFVPCGGCKMSPCTFNQTECCYQSQCLSVQLTETEGAGLYADDHIVAYRKTCDIELFIAICRPACMNNGTCQNPNDCKCPTWSTGRYTACSEVLACSYRQPCYPGDCTGGKRCNCEPGFVSRNITDGCVNFDTSHTKLQPVVGKSNVTLSNIRRTDNRVNFMFILEGTSTASNNLETIWVNQKRFNNLRFEYETFFEQPKNLPEKPSYVSNTELGIVESNIDVNVSKVSRNGSRIRDDGSFKNYRCEGGFFNDSPAKEKAICVVNDDQFKTLIEHGDWMNIKFKSNSGGFQKIIDLDNKGAPYDTKYYQGLQTVKEVQFNFDFIAPKHCSEAGAWGSCTPDSKMLHVEEEFTKNPIKVYWKGWTDDLSGIWDYYVEIFKLGPDPYDRLTEITPLKPEFKTTANDSSRIAFPHYRPKEPGMYSVLMETRDRANNSRIARRFVLYDDKSEITVSQEPDRQLYISSAVQETGYKWQTTTAGQEVTIDVKWSNHFVNKIHEDNKLLNSIEPYPMQFKDIEDDGVLFSKKYVADNLDDNDGNRTRKAITNFHGIVKFEIAKEHTLSDVEPNTWDTVEPFQETKSFKETLADGDRVRVWIRATDIMGNMKTDSTLVRVDSTPPTISKNDSDDHKFERNVENGKFNYTSRLHLLASDQQSGVHKLGVTITISTHGHPDRVVYTGFSPASTSEDKNNPKCMHVEGKCFIANQKIDLDNCWFMTMKSELDTSTAGVTVTAYNQALLKVSTRFKIGAVKELKGLEKYDGPQNIRVESPSPTGFRVAWDLPEKTSCYGRAEIVLVLMKKSAMGNIELYTYYAPGTSKFLDILQLEPETEYEIEFGMKTSNSSAVQKEISLAIKTIKREEGINAATVGGVVGGAVGLVIVVIVVVVVLIRKGFIRPPERAQRMSRALSRRVRRTVNGEVGDSHELKIRNARQSRRKSDRNSDLYIYGGMDMAGPQIWHIERNDVILETLIKSGNFANIYKARLKGRKSGEVVVAKTLKEGYTTDDEFAMKAKINFSGSKVGDHPNILQFIGAVVNDEALGPFIIYEYCERGTLKDYLEENKNNVTLQLQEHLFRFGLDIAKGMEYLASKQIVHRRLAARNILLTFLNEVKIAGFGIQMDEEDGGDAEQGKRERIPIKWMAPECMSSTKKATEKSDVWSYAVVLWEIFSLGESPYTGRARDLPGRIKKGERLPKPEQCDDTWYAVMQKCWMYDQKKRPTFAAIRDELDNMFVAAPGDEYYYKR